MSQRRASRKRRFIDTLSASAPPAQALCALIAFVVKQSLQLSIEQIKTLIDIAGRNPEIMKAEWRILKPSI
jgi:hypothetical protein